MEKQKFRVNTPYKQLRASLLSLEEQQAYLEHRFNNFDRLLEALKEAYKQIKISGLKYQGTYYDEVIQKAITEAEQN